MSARPLPMPQAGARAPYPLRGPSSIFTKGLRDSRRAILGVGLAIGGLVMVVGILLSAQFPTVADRLTYVAEVRAMPPAISGLFGSPDQVDRLGGFLSYRYGWLIPLLLGAWSILALSGTLAGELQAGSLEELAGGPFSRRRLATEKLGVHLAGLAVVVLVMAGFGWLTGVLFGRLAGDAISPVDAFAQFGSNALVGLVGGAIAFAIAPFLGRAVAATIGAVGLFGAFLVTAYASVVPAFRGIDGISWFTWTANQRPLADRWDLTSLLPVLGLIVALLVIGVIAFQRRDLGATIHAPSLALPGGGWQIQGPAALAFRNRLPAALAWGIAIGIWSWAVASSALSLVTTISADPSYASLLDTLFRGHDWRTAAGGLQLFFFSFSGLALALAGAQLVSGIAADERERRLELLLSTRVSRARWMLSSGIGVYGSIALVTLIVALFVAAGIGSSGQDAAGPFVGVWVGGLYAAAVAGIALAVIGLGRIDLGVVVGAAVAVGCFLWDFIGSALNLSPDVLNLSLTEHLGQPMLGSFDWPGMALLAVLAIGGPLLGAWGLSRRDVSR